jgi:hypothetical protein
MASFLRRYYSSQLVRLTSTELIYGKCLNAIFRTNIILDSFLGKKSSVAEQWH